MLKIISIIDGVFSIDQFESKIEYKPKLKYKIDRVSAINPTVRIKKYPYHEDIFEVSSVVSPAEWKTLYNRLNSPVGNGLEGAIFFIEFERDEEVVQFSVVVDELPPSPDDSRFVDEEVKYSFVAIYENYTPIDLANVYGYGNSYGENYGF